MSTSPPTNILIFGSTVVIGHFITDELLLAKEIDTVISAVGRNVVLSQSPSSTGPSPPPASSASFRARPYSDLFLGKGSKRGEKAGSFDVQGRKAVVLGDGKGKISFTSMRDVGVLLVAALLHPAEPGKKIRTFKANSFTVTPEEIVKEYERQTDERWEVEYTSLESLKKGEEEAWESGDPLATMWTLWRIWTEGGTLYKGRDNGRIGEPEVETLEEHVRKSIEKQMKA